MALIDEWLNIGSSPCGEDCVQVGTEAGRLFEGVETEVFRDQLRAEFPHGRFEVKRLPHDFGTYREVVAYYDPDNADQLEAAFEAESAHRETWTPESVLRLQAAAAAVPGWEWNGAFKKKEGA